MGLNVRGFDNLYKAPDGSITTPYVNNAGYEPWGVRVRFESGPVEWTADSVPNNIRRAANPRVALEDQLNLPVRTITDPEGVTGDITFLGNYLCGGKQPYYFAYAHVISFDVVPVTFVPIRLSLEIAGPGVLYFANPFTTPTPPDE